MDIKRYLIGRNGALSHFLHSSQVTRISQLGVFGFAFFLDLCVTIPPWPESKVGSTCHDFFMRLNSHFHVYLVQLEVWLMEDP